MVLLKKNNFCYLSKFISIAQKCGGKKKIEKYVFIVLRGRKKEKAILPRIELENIVEKIRPFVGLTSKKIGSVIYKIPVSLKIDKEISLGIYWIVKKNSERKVGTFLSIMRKEFSLIEQGQSKSLREKEFLYKVAEKNRVYIKFLL